MEFIKQMRKREFIEMSLKCAIALLSAFIAIILMEGMIYGIQLNALKTMSSSSQSYSNSTIAYAIKEDDNKYFVVYYNEGSEKEWSAVKDTYLTREQCEDLAVKEVVYHAPNAFQLSITGVHFVVMAVFVSAVAGYFAYRFVMLSKAYQKIEKEYQETGTIEISNF